MSSAVAKWRGAVKIRMIKAMGDHCQICGYDKCIAALEFHHLDPNEKEFSFGTVLANPKSWDKIVIELRKCIMLCANCHREVHMNLAQIPDNYKTFDEKYADYRSITEGKKCMVCDKDIPTHRKFCSKECNVKRGRGRIPRKKPDHAKIRTMKNEGHSNIYIGNVLSISEATVRKSLKRNC